MGAGAVRHPGESVFQGGGEDGAAPRFAGVGVGSGGGFV